MTVNPGQFPQRRGNNDRNDNNRNVILQKIAAHTKNKSCDQRRSFRKTETKNKMLILNIRKTFEFSRVYNKERGLEKFVDLCHFERLYRSHIKIELFSNTVRLI